ncbi:hypothetical protein BSNT_09431 [Bacillus subtilis subsp. natto BEST195]|nr:hypothetical protein BSNT_09431 [Bacillus subtilis subsp. natto BEST195]
MTCIPSGLLEHDAKKRTETITYKAVRILFVISRLT